MPANFLEWVAPWVLVPARPGPAPKRSWERARRHRVGSPIGQRDPFGGCISDRFSCAAAMAYEIWVFQRISCHCLVRISWVTLKFCYSTAPSPTVAQNRTGKVQVETAANVEGNTVLTVAGQSAQLETRLSSFGVHPRWQNCKFNRCTYNMCVIYGAGPIKSCAACRGSACVSTKQLASKDTPHGHTHMHLFSQPPFGGLVTNNRADTFGLLMDPEWARQPAACWGRAALPLRGRRVHPHPQLPVGMRCSLPLQSVQERRLLEQRPQLGLGLLPLPPQQSERSLIQALPPEWTPLLGLLGRKVP